jgi:hypothetical protein
MELRFLLCANTCICIVLENPIATLMNPAYGYLFNGPLWQKGQGQRAAEKIVEVRALQYDF